MTTEVRVITMTADELAALVEGAVARGVAKALAEHAPKRTGPERLTVPEVADELRCSERTVWRRLEVKTLRALHDGGQTYVLREELDRYKSTL